MADQPIKELKEIRREIHMEPHTRAAVIVSGAFVVLTVVFFLFFARAYAPSAPLPVDPVMRAAGVAPDRAEPASGVQGDITDAPPPVALAAPDISPVNPVPQSGSGAKSAAPPVVYAPAPP